MMLDILIPTYNRKKFLEKNINMLLLYIRKLNCEDKVRIIISNNASSDDTKILLNTLDNDNITYYNQSENIGLEKNAIFVLSKSTAKYCMYLGDDDYIDILYLKNVLEYIENNKNITCIIPSIQAIDMNGNLIDNSVGRDLNLKTTLYKGSISTAQKLFQKGHQLSGVLFLRKNTLESYLDSGYRNIYLFMYFVGYNSLRGDTIHLIDYPVKVTQAPQVNKDWGYGTDGLIEERIKNCHAIFKGKKIQILKAERFIIYFDRGYGYRYLKDGYKAFFKYMKTILFSNYINSSSKLFFLLVSSGIFIKYHIQKVGCNN